MDAIILVFHQQSGGLLSRAMCFEADDLAGALTVYANLEPELRPQLYQAQRITPEDLAGGAFLQADS